MGFFLFFLQQARKKVGGGEKKEFFESREMLTRRLMSHLVMMLMMTMVRRRRCFAVNHRGGCLIMISVVLLLLLRMMLCHCGSIDLHVLKLMLICRHQFHLTIKSVLLGRMLLLLRHNDLQLLWVVLVGVDELRRGIARHEHDVLALRLESLRGRSGRW